MTLISEDTKNGLNIATNKYMDLLNTTVTTTWLLKDTFTIIILSMDSAPPAEYSDVVLCGAYVDINNCLKDGLATISNSMGLLRNLNYEQPQQIKPIWNGFHLIILRISMMEYTCVVY